MHRNVRTRASVLDRDHRLVTVGMIALVSLGAFEAMAVTAAMPSVADALDGIGLYPLAFAMPLATGIVGMAAGGVVSDARGPRTALLGGVVAFCAGLAIAGTAPTMGVLTVGRSVQGFGSGVYIVALYVVVAHQFPKSLQPRVFAAFAAAWVLPALIGPAVAGLMVDHLGWRWVFLSVPALALVAVALLIPSMRPSRVSGGRDQPDLSRVGWSLIAAAGAIAFHLAGAVGPGVAAVLVAAGVLGLFVAVPRLLPKGTARLRPGLPSVIAMRGMVSAAFVSAEVLVPLLLNRERGLSPGTAGLALTAAAVSWSLGSWWQGRDSAAVSRWRMGRYGTCFVVAGIATSSSVAIPDVPVYVVLVTWATAGLGMGIVMPTLSLLTLSASEPGDEGRNSSALQISDALASAVALAVTGTAFLALLDAGGLIAYVVGFAAAASLAALAAAYGRRLAAVPA